jgi:hypothetical protein
MDLDKKSSTTTTATLPKVESLKERRGPSSKKQDQEETTKPHKTEGEKKKEKSEAAEKPQTELKKEEAKATAVDKNAKSETKEKHKSSETEKGTKSGLTEPKEDRTEDSKEGTDSDKKEHDDVKHEGWLLRKAKNKWKRRWVVLESGDIRYYKSSPQSELEKKVFFSPLFHSFFISFD